MPLMNSKNMAISQAAGDLGLGDMLRQQTEDMTEEERRKRMRQMQQASGATVGSAAMDLLGGAGAFS
jgi:hypothetical protein